MLWERWDKLVSCVARRFVEQQRVQSSRFGSQQQDSDEHQQQQGVPVREGDRGGVSRKRPWAERLWPRLQTVTRFEAHPLVPVSRSTLGLCLETNTNGAPGPVGSAESPGAALFSLAASEAKIVVKQHLFDVGSYVRTVWMRFPVFLVILIAFAPLLSTATTPPGSGTSPVFVADSRIVVESVESTSAMVVMDSRIITDRSRSVAATVSLDTRRLDGLKGFAESGRVPMNVGGARAVAFSSPIQGGYRLTLGFGANLSYEGRLVEGHLGQDYGAPTGTSVRAIANGRVALRQADPYPGEDRGMGNTLILRHELPEGQVVYSLYGHLSRMDVAVGERVSQGDTIGAVGETGFATGPHLHFEIKEGGSMPAIGGGYAGISFSGDTFVQAGVTYHNPIAFIEGRTEIPEAGGPGRVAQTGGAGLRLRSAPGLGAGILDVMPEGAGVHLVDGESVSADGYNWVRVDYDGVEGWAATRYLVLLDDAFEEEPLGAPVNLAQYRGDGRTPLGSGETLHGSNVVLEARLPGIWKLSMRLEVEGINLQTGQMRRERSLPLTGAGHVQVPVRGLQAGPYSWRARVIDVSGRSSDWTVWNDDPGLSAFTVPVGTAPVARIATSVSNHARRGDTVVFDGSQSRYDTGSATYQWQFSDGQVAEGATVEREFDNVGEIRATLIVTDSQGRKGNASETIVVVDADLLAAVENLVNHAFGAFDELEQRTNALAAEVNFFERRIAQKQQKVVHQLISDVMVSGITYLVPALHLGDSDEEIAEKFVRAILGDIVDEIRERVFALLGRTPTVRGEYTADFLRVFRDSLKIHRDQIQTLRDEVLAEMADLDDQTTEQILNEINAKIAALFGMRDYYSRLSQTPISFASLLREDEESWSWKLAQLSHGVGMTAGNVAIGAKGGWVAGATAKLYGGASDAIDTIEGVGREAVMLELGIVNLWEGLVVSGKIRESVMSSLDALRSGEPLTVPDGSIEVIDSIDGQTRFLGTRYEITDAQSDIWVTNTGESVADYWVYVIFPEEFSTVSLPYRLFSLSRTYEVFQVAESRGIEISPGESKRIPFSFLSRGEGMNPMGRQLTYGLFAGKGENVYFLRSKTREFQPGVSFAGLSGKASRQGSESLLQSNQEFYTATDAEDEEVESFVTPLFVNIRPGMGSSDYHLMIGMRNPFETVVSTDFETVFEDDWDVLSVEGASVEENGRVYGERDLWPGETTMVNVSVRVRAPDAADSFPSVRMTLWDPLRGEGLEIEREGPSIEVEFLDGQLELAIRNELGVVGEDLTLADLRRLSLLDLSGTEIHSLRGLEHASNLETIEVEGGRLASLSPFASLRNLQYLNVRDNRVRDIEPLVLASRGGAFQLDGKADLRGNPDLDFSEAGLAGEHVRELREADIVVFTAPDGTYESWREHSFAPRALLDTARTAPAGNIFPGDIVNLIKYASGHPPDTRGPLAPVRASVNSDGYIEVSFERNLESEDVVYRLEQSDDLQTWRTIARANGSGAFETDEGTKFIVFEEAVTGNNLRGKVTLVSEEPASQGAKSRTFRLRVYLSD